MKHERLGKLCGLDALIFLLQRHNFYVLAVQQNKS